MSTGCITTVWIKVVVEVTRRIGLNTHSAPITTKAVLDYLNYEVLNITLWVNLTGEWEPIGSKLCEGSTCAETHTFNFTQHNFTCEDIGFRNFKFNVTDVFGYTNETSGVIEIKPDDVFVTTEHNPPSINREGLETGWMSIKVYDSDNKSMVPENVNGSLWITLNDSFSSYGSGVRIQTNSSGYFNYDFDPNCSYTASGHYWTGGVLNEKCYKDRNITSPEYFEIYGQLKNYLNIPSYQVFNVTELVPIMFTTYSDCKGVSERPEENPVANASSYTIEVYHPDEGWLSCSSENLYNGSYNCTFDSTGHREGNWSIRFNSSKDYFNDNTTIYPDQFWLENLNTTSGNGTIWILENGAWTQTWSGGWSRLYNYTLDVYDVEGDTVNCSLYLSKDNGTSWFYVGSDVINGIAGTPTKGTCSVMYHGFTCSDIDSHEGENWDESKAKWFKWMVEDNEPTDTYNTIPVQGPNITESNVRIDYITGNGTTLYRNHDTSRLGVNVFDNENQSYPSGVNVSYWVTNDSIHYRLEMINETNGLGNASYYFSPNCSHLVGPQYWPQYWKAGVEDKCYIDKNVSNNFTYWLIGWLNGTIEGIRNQTLDRRTIFLNGTNVTINATVLDECSVGVESSYVNITLIHESSKEYRCSPVNDLGGGEYSCIFNTSENPDPMLARWYNISVLTNKTPWYVYNYSLRYIPETGSGPGAFFIETKPILSNPMVNTSSGSMVKFFGSVSSV